MTPERVNDQQSQASLELLYHVSRELAAALDTRAVLERVLSLSLQTVEGTSGSIIVLDDHGKPVDSTIIYNNQVFEQTTQQLRDTLEDGLAGWVVEHGEAALVTDTAKDERWIQRPATGQHQRGPKSTVSAPLKVRAQVVGVMTLSHPKPGFFDQNHLQLVQAIADQAGIRVLNARLYDESRRRARVMSALAESAASIGSSLDLEVVLQHILEQTSRALQVEAVTLGLIDPDEKELVFRAAIGVKREEVVWMRVKLGQGVAGWVAEKGDGLVVPDVSADPRFHSVIDSRIGYRTQAIACAPIRSGGDVIGVLEAINPVGGQFPEDALPVLTGIGNLAGTAIRHAQLFQQEETARRRYLELFEDSIDPILVSDWDGHIVEANREAAAITGLDEEALLQHKISDLHAIDVEVVGEGFAELQDERARAYESQLTRSSGLDIPIEVHVHRVDIDGAPRLQWIFKDITVRKNLDNLREDLSSMIYHDLRSPLTNVVAGLDLLKSMVEDQEDDGVDSVIEIAQRSTERVQRLVDSLLDITRLEAGRPVGEREANAVAKLVAEAVAAVEPVARGKEQRIETEVADGLPEVLVDADMITRVLINLMENASKYTQPESTITVGATKKGDGVELWVADNGGGIPPEEQERIFDKFARVGGSARRVSGVGLGLAFCKLAVEGHGGRIWVESEVGKGARFNLTLPAA